MTAKTITALAGFILVLAMANTANAAKLFSVDASFITGSGVDIISIENSSFPKLMKDFITGSGDFTALSGKKVYSGDIRFFGVPDVLKLNVITLADNTYSLHLTSALTGVDHTFVGPDKESIRRQMIGWFFLEGGDDSLDFLEALSLEATAAISDGNPSATTAQMADTAFSLFGFYPRSSKNLNMRGHESGAHTGLDVRTDSFTRDTLVGKMEGTRTHVGVPLWLHFNQRISYIGQLQGSSISIEGTDFYAVGTDMGFAFRPVVRTDDDIFGWQIAPYIGVRAIGSVDGVTAAVLYNYGLNNRFEFRIFKRCLLSWVAQITKLDNLTISVSDYELNTKVDQRILKNGLMFEAPIGPLKWLYANCFIMDTRFLEEATTSSYQTVGAGLQYVMKRFSARASLAYDMADDYNNTALNLGISWDL